MINFLIEVWLLNNYKKMTKKLLACILLSVFGTCSILSAQTTFKVATYNVLAFPNGANNTPGGTDADRLTAFQMIMEDMNPDILIVQELKTTTGANSLLNALNTSNLNKTFARTINAPDSNSGTGGNMLFYNTALFTLVSESGVPRTNTAIASSGNVVTAPRSADVYQLDIADPATGTVTPVYFFSTHLKAGSSDHSSDPSQIPDDERRSLGAQDIMDYIQQNLGSDDNIIIVGDMNFRDETEPGYIDFISNSAYTNLFTDPLGPWTRDSQSSVSKFTQSTRTANGQLGNGGAGGGFCDRFDFLLFNDDINTGNNGIGYDNSSMQTYGSTNINVNQSALTGTHPLRQQLYNVSDHFPVTAEFTLDDSPPPPSDDCTYSIDTSLVFIEDFSGFGGQGFTDDPASGQLCSNAWNFTGFSDGYVFGGINLGNDYARGSKTGDISQGGIYEYDERLWIQPTSSDFTSGTATMIVCNDTGNTIDSLELSFDVLILNDQDRSNKFDFAYSLNGTNYTPLPAMSQVSSGTSTGVLNVFPKNTKLYNLNILPDACFYLQWTGGDVSGSGSRDEFGLDNITLNVLQAQMSVCPPLILVDDVPITGSVYQADTIISAGTVSGTDIITFKATDCIKLDNGFIGIQNFSAEIEDCGQ